MPETPTAAELETAKAIHRSRVQDVAEDLRERAYALHRRSDNVPLHRDGTGIDKVAALRTEADELIRRADVLDPPARQEN